MRRVHIPKGDGAKTRPIGIPTFEDKVLQRAVAMVLEAVYEQDFHAFSYGFRPKRSAHDALEALQGATMRMAGGMVLEVDISKFFDTIDHAHLREILGKRVRDGVILRLIGKWLNAGALEGGVLSHADAGTPQGGVISPLLANVYLHEVLDEWFVHDVIPRLKGRAVIARYADDFVMVFSREDDACRVHDVLPKRFAKYGLTLHPEKTRLVAFRKPGRTSDDDGDPGSFDLLGFTHHWALSRRGNWVVKRRTANDRFARALGRITNWCKEHRHTPIGVQWRTLVQKLRGHYAYYGIAGNADAIARFLHMRSPACGASGCRAARNVEESRGNAWGTSSRATRCLRREFALRHGAKPRHEEPDAGNLHVRIRGGPAGRPAGLPESPPRQGRRPRARRDRA